MACVYVIAEDGAWSPVKIGVSHDSRTRLDTLQTGNHRLLRVIAEFRMESRSLAYEIENMAHRHFAAQLIRGEWFSVDVETAIRFVRNCAGSGMRRFVGRQEPERETADEIQTAASC